METEALSPLTTFHFEGKDLPVSFVETMHVVTGVDCDVYTFVGDSTKDLGIIKIQPGYKTPLQRVLKGDRTIEGYVSGKGNLMVTDTKGNLKTYKGAENLPPIEVKIGELMQWEADKDSSLVAYEVCLPPYETGRYENL